MADNKTQQLYNHAKQRIPGGVQLPPLVPGVLKLERQGPRPPLERVPVVRRLVDHRAERLCRGGVVRDVVEAQSDPQNLTRPEVPLVQQIVVYGPGLLLVAALPLGVGELAHQLRVIRV